MSRHEKSCEGSKEALLEVPFMCVGDDEGEATEEDPCVGSATEAGASVEMEEADRMACVATNVEDEECSVVVSIVSCGLFGG